MNVRKFIAASAREALRKVKEVLGDDAVILSNRSIAGGVEIMAMAASDMETILPPEDREPRAPDPEPEIDDYVVSLSAAPAVPSPGELSPGAPAMLSPGDPPRRAARPEMRENGAPPLSPRPMPRIDPPAPAMSQRPAEVVPAEVMSEIRSLRRMVEQHLASFAWGEEARAEPVKTEVMRRMLEVGFSPRLARDLLVSLPRELDASRALAWAKNAADRALLTIGYENDIIDRGGVYALVGPTGVGKTTTTAKLAARCVLRHGAGKVALITTDGYRIGAHEQLRIYGRILGVSVFYVKDAEDLRQTLMGLTRKHMVLIDTIGMSQRDRMVEEQSAMFALGGVKRLLLLAATGRGDTLDDVVRAYGGPALSGCILSKVDEAASLAAALDVIIRHRLPLHYVSNGQRVPEDLHLPNRMYLLHRAFKDAPEASPHRLDGMEPRLVMASGEAAAVGGRRG
ncbi:MAG: flagellar biosynthesis protein FlhF [Candidatus Accumulibacter sp.]|jgi:flagellar biosynthesis protein FlhF|nr:flagellar biosynthesis protein FlhF [Accumulibacter sp.]